MLHADATETLEQLKDQVKPLCSVFESTEASVDAQNHNSSTKAIVPTPGQEELETTGSPENLQSPQRLKKTGNDDPTDLNSPRSGSKAKHVPNEMQNDSGRSERKVQNTKVLRSRAKKQAAM